MTIRWLLRQCGRIETESRRKCIELVCTFIPLLPGRTCFTSQQLRSPSSNYRHSIHPRIFRTENQDRWQHLLHRKVRPYQPDMRLTYRLTSCRFEGTAGAEKKTRFKASLASAACLTDMSDQFSLPMVYQWLDTVIASLDCYTWVFSQGFLNPLLLQGRNN